jgi:HEAT repeat protein
MSADATDPETVLALLQSFRADAAESLQKMADDNADPSLIEEMRQKYADQEKRYEQWILALTKPGAAS